MIPLTAEEVRQKSIKGIYKLMETAASDGKFSVTINDILPEWAEKRFESEGFEVITYSSTGKTIIYWS